MPPQNKNISNSVVQPSDASAFEGSVAGGMQTSSDPQSLSLNPAPSTTPSPASDSLTNAEPQPAKRNFILRLLSRADILLALLLVLGALGLFWSLNREGRNGSPTAQSIAEQYGAVTLPLDDFVTDGTGISLANQQVVINGSLQANGSVTVNSDFVLAPQAQPVDPLVGQIYYDQTSNVLAYYDGTEFVSVGGINSIQGAGGITVTDDGAGNVTITGTDAGAAGVTSLQGQTGDLTLTPGSGIGIDGTTISNTGVIDLESTNSTLVITDDGGGNFELTVDIGGAGVISLNSLSGDLNLQGTTNQINVASAGDTITLTTPQDIATSSSPTFSNLILQGGTATLGTMAQQGSLVLHDGNGQTTTLQPGDSAGDLTFILPTNSGSDTQCLKQGPTPSQLIWDACDGGTGGTSTDLQDAYENGNTISASDAEGDIDFTLTEATNFLTNITGTGRFAVQSSGTDVMGVTPTDVTLGTDVDLFLQGPSAYISNPQTQTASEAFGLNATVGASEAVAVGNTATVNDSGGVAIGQNALSRSGGVAIGRDTITGASGGGVAIGDGAVTSNAGVAIGNGSSTTGNSAVALGVGATSDFEGVALGDGANAAAWSIALGQNATSGQHQFVVGGPGSAPADDPFISDVYIGNGVTDATPIDITYHATGGDGTDIAGAALNLAGGRGTGAGNGGDISLQVALPTGSGGSLNDHVTALNVSGNSGVVSLGTSGAGGLNGQLAWRNTTNSNTITVQGEVATANQTITLPNDTGTVCLTSGNCAGVGGTGDVLQNGNAFGTTMTLGTNDNFDFGLETRGTTWLTLEGATLQADSAPRVVAASNVDLIMQGATAYISNPQGQTNSEAFGLNASVSSNDALAVGNGASASNDAIAVGTGATAGQNATALGADSSAGQEGVAIGNLANADFQSIAIGTGAEAGDTSGFGGSFSIAIGYNAVTAGNDQIALGYGATTTADNQLVIGSNSSPMTDIFLGSGIEGSAGVAPDDTTINATDGNGTDIAGAALNIAGGQGTGAAAGGDVNIQVSAAGSSGSSLNPLATVATFSATEQLRLSSDSTNFTSFTVASDGNLTISANGTVGNSIYSTDLLKLGTVSDPGTAYNYMADSLADVSSSFSSGAGNDSLYIQGRLEVDGGIYPGVGAGEVLFGGIAGVIDGDGSLLHFDSSNVRLGIGESTPQSSIHINRANVDAVVELEATGTASPFVVMHTGNNDRWSVGVDDNDNQNFKISQGGASNGFGTNDYFVIDRTTGDVGVGNASPERQLDVAVNDSSTTAPPFRVMQEGSGDASLEFNDASAKSFFLGMDASNGSTFKIASSTSASASFDEGYTNEGSICCSTIGSDDIWATKVTVGGTGGTLSSISLYTEGVDGSFPGAQVAIYTHDSGNNRPGDLIDSSGTQSLSEGWNTFAVSGTISASTTYWLAYNFQGDSTRNWISGAGESVYYTSSTFGTWPDPAGAQDSGDADVPPIYMSIAPTGSVDTFGGVSLLELNDSGAVTFQNSSDSGNAFRILDESGSSLFGVSTSGNRIDIDSNELYLNNISTVDSASYNVLCIHPTNRDVLVGASETSCASSSERFKENISDLQDELGLDVVNALRPVDFTYKYGDGDRKIGLIAEEVAEVLPEVVAYDEEDQPYAINYEYMVANLIKAIQQQQVQIDELREGVLSGALVEISGHIRVGGDTAGTVTIPAGQTSATVTFDTPYEFAPKITTGASDFAQVIVTDKTVDGFTVRIQTPHPTDIKIDWTALEVE